MELQSDVPIAADGRPDKYKTQRLVVATVPSPLAWREYGRSACLN